MDGSKRKKRTYIIIILAVFMILGVLDFVRSQNVVQFAYSHFQACLLEYDLAMQEYLDTKNEESLESAKSAVEHVEHMDSSFLKYHTLSEPIYRKRRAKLSNYLRLLTEYTKYLQDQAAWNMDIEEQVKVLYDGNREIEELLIEDSMDFDSINKSTQDKVLDRVSELTDVIQEEMEE
ncbi:MAG: hypothetical protein EOM40_02925 [Clostridia bacterium]|nr:hypothetical protein [Clostridia bacterium]NCC43865.1 hypothetical protein [Clostridia bacterium]